MAANANDKQMFSRAWRFLVFSRVAGSLVEKETYRSPESNIRDFSSMGNGREKVKQICVGFVVIPHLPRYVLYPNATPNANFPPFRMLDSYTIGMDCVLDVVRGH